MTASSQTPPEALPPELSPAQRLPERVPMSGAAQAAFASYGAVFPVPAGTAQQAPIAETVRAAAGVLEAAMTNGAHTPQDLAQAEADAGILFDPQKAEDIATAAAEQAHAQDQAELAERGRQVAVMAGARRRVDAVGRLIEGRPGYHLLPVAEIAAAAEYAATPYDGLPMTLTWTGRASVPDAHTTHRQVALECVSSYGGSAHLLIEGDARATLGGLLDEEARDIHAPCQTDGCGTVDDYGTSDPALMGWARLEVAGLDDEPRWYCSPQCIADALARAGDELAADDQAAAVDPGEQAQPAAAAVDQAAEDVPRCVRCGCTAAAACEGGCGWIPNLQLVDLCSACATPEELAAAGWRVVGGGQ
ncbi:hypothetical protein [Streptomyces fuscichromogenes]|uniref:Uncharacterized protein n=1 Tax=Streptomyces fuscichromogenes TaxID=1324013 RepID=A0A917XPM6_9ACTN|nr:hypothetical protein [Streptomyces fuscichromogenes]GGN47233.1 hypothetical protein GCM10011578_100710 [Streptomyces fuscichromogenes]